ncbi:MAG: DUF4860 domain-containing protein [Coriobacteriales bacterium]|nr:DUF4860 domain-containing protein [Coriobacteriales bacterium]
MSRPRIDVMDAVAMTSSRHASSSNDRRRLFALLLFAVFVTVVLIAMVVGIESYGTLVKMSNSNDARLMSLSPLVSNVRANDVSGSVAVGTGPEGRSLVLVHSDSMDTYETRIYLYEGNIVQEYALAGNPYTPSKATVLSASNSFEFSYSDDLLSITTDAGTAKVALRNIQGGA